MNESGREIMVSQHVVNRYRERRGGDRRPFATVHDEIVGQIREGMKNGRVFNHKPEGFVLYGRRSDRLPSSQRFVLCDARYGFVIERKPDGRDIVMTMLTRVGVRR